MTDDQHAPAAPSVAARLWSDGFGRFAMRCLQVIVVVTLAIGLVYAGLALKTVVIAVLVALILACAFHPLVRLLERAKLPSALAALITLVVVLGVLAGVLTLVGFSIAGQASDLTKAVSDGIDQLEKFLAGIGIQISGAQVQQAVDGVTKFVTSASFGSGALAGLSTVGNLATGIVLVVFVMFFFLRDGKRIWEFLISPFRAEAHARAERIGHRSVGVLGAYVRGTATVALVDSVFIGAGLFILQVPLALTLSVFVFVTAFIPVVGATLAGILAALVALVFKGPIVALIVVGIVVLVNQLEGNLLQPVIMGKALSLHPLVILLALTAGTILGGIIGAILSVPTASVVWTAIKAWYPKGREDDERPAEAVEASGHGS
ncbi:AI-2E family transporter [Amnibacterium kyonggiense]|uniref:Putative PurR-regulated permease PerM n=1 Tax=Amnibacterium kyonggiense TaxID=595671 RepID=A0A4R7FPH9_9MICO|nr:AI-2E family transporter [Amnibacterium kyonggiense]TDS79655.1 putative PurR-regulated permease PerM [Amnibacterium kyonggiense]